MSLFFVVSGKVERVEGRVVGKSVGDWVGGAPVVKEKLSVHTLESRFLGSGTGHNNRPQKYQH